MAGPGLGPGDQRGDPAWQEKGKGGRMEGEPGRNQLLGSFPNGAAARAANHQVRLGLKRFLGDRTPRLKPRVVGRSP